MARKPDFTELHQDLLAWYDRHKRDLPWRISKDPYRIWISEIMLQQTRVEAVIPYYERFLAKFPDVRALAASQEDEVTALWAGLGYYSRARNLRAAALQAASAFGGELPRELTDLRTLKGIGPYTAAAIASIAFAAPHAAVDGNLERVIARLLALRGNPKKEGAAAVHAFAQKLVELGRPGDVNQAFMDLSSALCLPKNPLCGACPLSPHCEALAKGIAADLPYREAPPEKEWLDSRGLVLIKGDKLLLARRKPGTWLAGMWDLPWWVPSRNEKPELKKLSLGNPYGSASVKRTITRYKISFRLDFHRLTRSPASASLNKALQGFASEHRWVSLKDLDGFNLPRPSEKALRAALAALD